MKEKLVRVPQKLYDNKKMRLTDGDALCADLREQWEQVFSKTKTKVRPEDFFIERLSAFQAASIASDIETFVEYLGSRPTVDAVIVVRCKDCAFAKNAKWNKEGYRICPASHMEITDDDFCSYGERKEND